MNQFVPVRWGVAIGVASAVLLGLATAACDRTEPAEAVADKPSSNPCEDFAGRLCAQTANQLSGTCTDIKTTVDLFTPETCQLALDRVDHSLKVLGGRDLSCDSLKAKLCADTNPSTKACEQVKRYMKKFPAENCKQMLGRYPQVLAEVKQGLRLQ